MTDTSTNDQAANTDRELWRGPDEGNGDYYTDSIHVTKGGGIGINVGGTVIVKPLREWHALANRAASVPSEDGRREVEFLMKVRGVLGRRFPRCRDCADEDGTCPSSGLPCDLDHAFGEVIALMDDCSPASVPSEEQIAQAFCDRQFNCHGRGEGAGTCDVCLSIQFAVRDLNATRKSPDSIGSGALKLDTDKQVFFYEQDHYYLSNFSAFRLRWRGIDFDTSEHAYHWEKFDGSASHHPHIQHQIQFARSAHEAFKIAEEYKASRRSEWERIKLNIMSNILRAKVEQHEYVRRKLLATGDRELIENSWRDDFWGWGRSRDGQNMLGKLWMEIRDELRAASITSGQREGENG